METTGVVRRIDDLGRVVIPKEIRRTLGIKDGTSLEIFVDKDMVALKKHSSMNNLSHFAEVYVDSIYNALKKDIIITDRDNVIACAGALKKEYLMQPISSYLEECINNRVNIKEDDIKDLNIVNYKSEKCSYIINTIISNGDSIGLIIILSTEESLGELEEKTAQIASQFFGKHIEE
ncbi:MAG: AbrB/MazE/SpoVT family DNA-binding domain-containing protein [Bacilli bacterium]|nr:AbrB/MazE/SpoVT family DNA-binding domain-containing protein [Bacilli bacterium]